MKTVAPFRPQSYVEKVLAQVALIPERTAGDELLARHKLFLEQIELARHIRAKFIEQDVCTNLVDPLIHEMRKYIDALQVVLEIEAIKATITKPQEDKP